MKKLLFLLCFLSTSAFAIDKPIPCTGNSCKLLFETTGAGGAKVSAGNVDGLGKWTIGPAASGAYGSNDNHDINGNILFSGGLGFYGRQTAGGGGNTCNTQCDSEPTGFNVASGKCLAGWNSSGSASDCTTTLVSGFCFCAGIQ